MFDGNRAIAVIPTVFESPYLDALIVNLSRSQVAVFVVNNDPAWPERTGVSSAYGDEYTVMFRHWGIYQTWNFGLRLGAMFDKPVLILNDDIVLGTTAITAMVDTLTEGEWAILGFNYSHLPGSGPIPMYGSFRHGGVGGFAFGCNPKLCARVDRRFRWWGGDDDLFFSTERDGGKVGILLNAAVEHPQPSLTMNARPDLLPEGWQANDRDLLRAKWGSTW